MDVIKVNLLFVDIFERLSVLLDEVSPIQTDNHRQSTVEIPIEGLSRPIRKHTKFSETREVAEKFKQSDVVYFVENPSTRAIKIGVTKGLVTRLSALEAATGETLNVLHLIENANRDVEQQLHEKFHHLRKRGEWFSPGEDLLTFIESQKAQS